MVPDGMPPPALIDTARLRIDPLSPLADAAFILELLNQASFLRYIGDRGVRTLEQAQRYIEDGPVLSYRQHGFGLWRVALKDGGRAIGLCGLLKRDSLPDVDLGFAFLPDWWSQGYAFEAAAAVMEHARRVLGLRRIVAITAVDNAASARLLQKLGFVFEQLLELRPGEAPVKLFGAAV